jgi:AraC family transcriptional regulator of adaptative response/methylated-DNA-[protein]-cysteine methyltransferase
MDITYTTCESPLGWLLMAATPHGLCVARFGESAAALERGLAREFPAASIQRDDAALSGRAHAMLRHLAGQQPLLDLPLDVQTTAFQSRVYAALHAIPYGDTRTYREVAQAIGEPTAARAVAQACASNAVAVVIPCHRVVRGDGALGGYRWGVERKRALLAREAQASAAPVATQTTAGAAG